MMSELNIISNNFSKLYNEGVVVVEQPPIRRTIEMYLENRYNATYSKSDPNRTIKLCKYPSYSGNFFLSFPTIYFRIHYLKYRKKLEFLNLNVVFLDNKKKICVPPLPNIDLNMRVCVGLFNRALEHKFSNIDDLCRSIVVDFWSSQFNTEMSDAYERFYKMNSLLGDHRKWQIKTKSNPDWIPNRGLIPVKRDFTKDFLFGKNFSNTITCGLT